MQGLMMDAAAWHLRSDQMRQGSQMQGHDRWLARIQAMLGEPLEIFFKYS